MGHLARLSILEEVIAFNPETLERISALLGSVGPKGNPSGSSGGIASLRCIGVPPTLEALPAGNLHTRCADGDREGVHGVIMASSRVLERIRPPTSLQFSRTGPATMGPRCAGRQGHRRAAFPEYPDTQYLSKSFCDVLGVFTGSPPALTTVSFKG